MAICMQQHLFLIHLLPFICFWRSMWPLARDFRKQDLHLPSVQGFVLSPLPGAGVLSLRPWQLLGTGLCLGAQAGCWVAGGSLLQPWDLAKQAWDPGPAPLPQWGEPGWCDPSMWVHRAGAPSATSCPKGAIACV